MLFPSTNLIIGLLVGFAALNAVIACPYAAVQRVKREVEEEVERQWSDDEEVHDNECKLLGDLRKGITTPVGQSIANQLMKKESSESDVRIPAKKWPKSCTGSKDPCCPWYLISKELTTLFKEPTGECNDLARAAIRLGFHDASTWNKTLKYGGADGSLIINEEWTRFENTRLQTIGRILGNLSRKYKVGKADLCQFASNHGAVTCPLGPRVRTYIGRKDCPIGLQSLRILPPPIPNGDRLIALFKAQCIDSDGLVALLGAHSTSKQFFVNTSMPGAPQDTTPGIWDLKFYNETLAINNPIGVVKFASDLALSVHPKTEDTWKSFIDDQELWNRAYAYAYVRLSMLGVNNINKLHECTIALPDAQRSFSY